MGGGDSGEAEEKPTMIQKKKVSVGVSNLGGVQRVKKVLSDPPEKTQEKEPKTYTQLMH